MTINAKSILCLALVVGGLAVGGCLASANLQHESPEEAQADFVYSTNDGGSTITIKGYKGPGGKVIVPGLINGLPVTSIGDRAFWAETRVTSVIISDNVTTIGEEAFSAVDTPGSSITNLVIGNGVTTIKCGAFHFCDKLTSVRIPKSVAHIGTMAFGGCFRLKSIIVDPGNPAYRSVDGVLFSKDKTELVQYPPGKAGDYIIPNTVTNIADYALWNCERLTGITMPEGVTSIGNEEFAACCNLTTVIVPASVTNIGQNAFNSCVSMKGIYFCGNAPDYGEYWRGGRAKVLGGLDTGTAYYVAGTAGWGTNFGGRPTAQWKP